MTVAYEMQGWAHCCREKMGTGVLERSYQGPEDRWDFIHHTERVQHQPFPGWISLFLLLPHCLLWTECLCLPPPPPQFISWSLNSSVMVLGGEVFGRCLGHEGGALMNGVSALIRKDMKDIVSLLCGDTARRQLLQDRRRALARTQPCWHLDLGLPSL